MKYQNPRELYIKIFGNELDDVHRDSIDALMYMLKAPKLPWYKRIYFKVKRRIIKYYKSLTRN